MSERIEYHELDPGLFYALSPDLPGMIVFGHSRDELDAKLPAAIQEWREVLADEPVTLVSGPAW